MENILELIKIHKLKVMPILVEGKWSAGKVISINENQNIVPFSCLVKDDTLEEAVLQAIQIPIPEDYKHSNKKFSKMKEV